MRMMPSILIGALLLVVLGGCSTVQGTKVTDEQLAQFVKGTTTKDAVVAALGSPQDIRFEAGKQILVYRYLRTGMYMSDEASDTTFVFNEKGVLEDILKTRGSSTPDHHR